VTDSVYGMVLADAYMVRRVLREAFPWIEASPIVGVGWATVEVERAARELGDDLCVGWMPAPRDPLLGARSWRCADAQSERLVRPVLLEPDTEGRLAATLASFGEGVAAIYVLPDGKPDGQTRLSKAAEGPLGVARLVLGGPVRGPHALVLGGPVRGPHTTIPGEAS
jgi:hypothetical protein